MKRPKLKYIKAYGMDKALLLKCDKAGKLPFLEIKHHSQTTFGDAYNRSQVRDLIKSLERFLDWANEERHL